jgi:uncharacterized damage-inducible protein DinB
MRTRSLLLSLLALALPAALLAQAAAPADTAKAAYLAGFDDVAGKLKQLAEAIPEAKYGWMPAPGVRTVGQVVAHIAAGDYLMVKMAGMPMPADAPADPMALEKITAKQELLATLDKAIAFARRSAESATPEQLAAKVNFFGTDTTGRGLFLFMYGHMSEHLGQLIAYARSIGVTPPWSK